MELSADEPDPVEALGDTAYGGGQTRHDLAEAGHTAVVKPLPLRPAVPGGLDRDDLTVDCQAGAVTCPNQITVPISATGNASFGRRCDTCPLRAKCTTDKAGRSLHTSRPREAEHDKLLAAARAQAETPELAAAYPRRSLVERSLAWAVNHGRRRWGCRGVKRNQLWLSLRVAAVNLTTLLGLGLHYDGGWKAPATT